jgi:uncharacterized protein YqeY
VDHGPADAWRAALRAELTVAMRAREPAQVAVVRTLIAAIDNAEAVDVGRAPAVDSGRVAAGTIAGGVAGLRAGEVARRALTAADLREVVAGEIARRRSAADDLRAGGRPDRADDLLAEVALLETLGERLATLT